VQFGDRVYEEGGLDAVLRRLEDDQSEATGQGDRTAPRNSCSSQDGSKVVARKVVVTNGNKNGSKRQKLCFTILLFSAKYLIFHAGDGT
jgi:hypothetical protein